MGRRCIIFAKLKMMQVTEKGALTVHFASLEGNIYLHVLDAGTSGSLLPVPFMALTRF